MLVRRLVHVAALVAVGLTATGCLFNPWHTETYFDELTYPASNAATAIQTGKSVLNEIDQLYRRPQPLLTPVPATAPSSHS